jgi:hypothetical protein
VVDYVRYMHRILYITESIYTIQCIYLLKLIKIKCGGLYYLPLCLLEFCYKLEDMQPELGDAVEGEGGEHGEQK